MCILVTLQLHKDETLYMEAYEKTLDGWMTFLNDTQDLEEGALKQHAIEVVNTYLQCHLAPPDGTRRQVSQRYMLKWLYPTFPQFLNLT